MTLTKGRFALVTAAAIAALLSLLFTSAVDSATAGGDPGPRCQGKKVTVTGTTGTSGDDVMVGTPDNDEIDGKGGDDRICARRSRDVVFGGPGNDKIYGGAAGDALIGGPGNDRVRGQGGRESFGTKGAGETRRKGFIVPGIDGGPGDDILDGGDADDDLEGGPGNDIQNGSYGFDQCSDPQDDTEYAGCEITFISSPKAPGEVNRCRHKPVTTDGLIGTPGDDVIYGTPEADVIVGKGGNDRICGFGGADEIDAGSGNDRVFSGPGEDTVLGNTGNDVLKAQSGDDGILPTAQRGQDSQRGVYGGDGNDVLDGGSGDDALYGEAGRDTHFGGNDFDGCFDEDSDSAYDGCEFGSLPRNR